MDLGEIISKVLEKDESKVMLAPLSNIAGADIKFIKGYGTIKINVPADVADDLTNGSGKYVGGLLLIDRQAYHDAEVGSDMVDIDHTIAKVLKEMGVEPNKPARWKPHYYVSKADPPLGGKRQDGWFCSRCGKHSYARKKVCDGCDSEMLTEEGDK